MVMQIDLFYTGRCFFKYFGLAQLWCGLQMTPWPVSRCHNGAEGIGRPNILKPQSQRILCVRLYYIHPEQSDELNSRTIFIQYSRRYSHQAHSRLPHM